MKRLIKKATPEIGETVKLTDDSRYRSDDANNLSLETERDAPMLIMNGEVYYGENGATTHFDLWNQALEANDLVLGDNVDAPDLAPAYYINDYLGAPSVFIFKENNTANQAQIIKEDRPDVNVYVIHDNKLTRVATRVY